MQKEAMKAMHAVLNARIACKTAMFMWIYGGRAAVDIPPINQAFDDLEARIIDLHELLMSKGNVIYVNPNKTAARSGHDRG